MKRTKLLLSLLIFAVAAGNVVTAQRRGCCSIHGTVEDESGAIVSGVEIDLAPASGPIQATRTVSSATGQFEFRDLSKGLWVVLVPGVNGFAPAQTRINAIGGYIDDHH